VAAVAPGNRGLPRRLVFAAVREVVAAVTAIVSFAQMRVWVVAAAVAVALAAGGLVGWRLTRPPSFQEPASVSALARALDDVVPEALRRHGVPGAAVAVARSGRVAWARGYGVADAARRTAVTAATVFQVASLSKPVAAMGALRLVEERRLALDRPLTAWRFAPSEHDRRAVTLRRLLSHTAGVSVPGYPGHEPGWPLPSTAASLAGDSAGAGAVRLQSDPGAGYSYSGGGYTVAQLAVERAAGEPFAAWMRRAVLRPLGMRSSSFDQATAIGALTARGHDHTGLPLPLFGYAEQAAAGLYATAPDIARFAAALMPGPHGEPPGRGVVSAATIPTMTTPAPATRGRYGLGFALRTLADDVHMVSHGGANRGWRALLAAFPQRGWGIAVLTNGDNGEAVIDAVLDLLVD
jgi:CubicO group peptidase (beta-lactamase class C family)